MRRGSKITVCFQKGACLSNPAVTVVGHGSTQTQSDWSAAWEQWAISNTTVRMKTWGKPSKVRKLKKVLILCRTSITQFQVVKVTNAEGIIGWGIFHPLICQLDGEAGLQLVAVHFDSGSFIFLPFVLESHTYKIRFLSWNEKLMIERKPGGIQSIFFSQNETF